MINNNNIYHLDEFFFCPNKQKILAGCKPEKKKNKTKNIAIKDIEKKIKLFFVTWKIIKSQKNIS